MSTKYQYSRGRFLWSDILGNFRSFALGALAYMHQNYLNMVLVCEHNENCMGMVPLNN